MPGIEAVDAQCETFLLTEWLEQHRDFLDEGVEIELVAHHLHSPGIDLREVENLVQDMEQVVGTAGNGLHGIALKASSGW